MSPATTSSAATLGTFISDTTKCEATDFKIISEISKALKDKENKKKYLEKMSKCKRVYLEAREKDNNAGNTDVMTPLLQEITETEDKERTEKFMNDLEVDEQLARFQQQIDTQQSETEMKKKFVAKLKSDFDMRGETLDTLPQTSESEKFIKAILTIDRIYGPLFDTFTVDKIYKLFKKKYSEIGGNKTALLLAKVDNYTNYASIQNEKFNEIYDNCSTEFIKFIKTEIFVKLQPVEKNSFFDKEENAREFVKLFLDEYFREGLDDFVNNIQTIIKSYKVKLDPIRDELEKGLKSGTVLRTVQPYSLTRLVKEISSLPGFKEDSFLISPGFNQNNTTAVVNTTFGFIKKVTPDSSSSPNYKIELENKTADTSKITAYITKVTLGLITETELKGLDNNFFNDGTGFKLFSDIKKGQNDILDEIISKLLTKEPIATLYNKGKTESKNYERMVFLLKDIIEIIRLNNKLNYPNDEIEKLKSIQQDIRRTIKGKLPTLKPRNITDKKLQSLQERTEKIKKILEFNIPMPTSVDAINALIGDNTKIIDAKTKITSENTAQDKINGKKLERILKLIQIKNEGYTFLPDEGDDDGYITNADSTAPSPDDLNANPPNKNNMLNNIKLLGPDTGINNILINELTTLRGELAGAITYFGSSVPVASLMPGHYTEVDTSAVGSSLGRKVYKGKPSFDEAKKNFLIVKKNQMQNIKESGINSKYPALEKELQRVEKIKGGAILKTGGKYTRKNKNIRKRSRKMKPKMKVSRKNKLNSKKNTKKNTKKYAKKKTRKRSRKIYKISRNSKRRSHKSMNY